MAMPLPVKPPLVLVEVSALNEAEVREGRQTVDRAAPAFHTRGLTLMQVGGLALLAIGLYVRFHSSDHVHDISHICTSRLCTPSLQTGNV
jgi:hypothetical protein